LIASYSSIPSSHTFTSHWEICIRFSEPSPPHPEETLKMATAMLAEPLENLQHPYAAYPLYPKSFTVTSACENVDVPGKSTNILKFKKNIYFRIG
jgi:hypothetical protein